MLEFYCRNISYEIKKRNYLLLGFRNNDDAAMSIAIAKKTPGQQKPVENINPDKFQSMLIIENFLHSYLRPCGQKLILINRLFKMVMTRCNIYLNETETVRYF